MQAMLLMSKASQDAARNCDRLADKEGEKGRSQAYSSAEEEAEGQNQGLNSKTYPAHPYSRSVVDSSHPAISRPRAQAGGDVESRGYPHQDDPDEGECQPRQKPTLPWKEINANLQGSRNDQEIKKGAKARLLAEGNPEEQNDATDQPR